MMVLLLRSVRSGVAGAAYGPGALAFTGVIDNTDVFFKLAQAAVKGVVAPADTSGARKPPKPKR